MNVSFIRPLPVCLATVPLLLLAGCFTWYSDKILGNHEHGLPCDALPTPGEVQQVLAEHQGVVAAIEAVKPGAVEVAIDELTWPFPRRHHYLLPIASRAETIEEIIQSETFFGAPYRLCNQ